MVNKHTHKKNNAYLLWVNGSHFGGSKAWLANSLAEIAVLIGKLQRPVYIKKKREGRG